MLFRLYLCYIRFLTGRQIHLDLVRKLSNKNIQPVIDAIIHAVLSKNPRKRYLVGTDANTIWNLMAMIPTFMGDIILNTITKPPAPSAMRKR